MRLLGALALAACCLLLAACGGQHVPSGSHGVRGPAVGQPPEAGPTPSLPPTFRGAPAADMGLSAGTGSSQTLALAGDQWAKLAYWAPLHYERVFVSYDAFGSWNALSGCVTPWVIGSQAGTIINALANIEREGRTPIIVMWPDIWGQTAGYEWPWGTENGVIPSDDAYACGLHQLIEAMRAWGLQRPGIQLEVFNEPDNPSYYTQPEQAAHYVGDAIWAGARNYFTLVSGTFDSPYDDGYANRYITYARTYGWVTNSWSVHDYNDVIWSANHGCDVTYAQGCTTGGVAHFRWWLQSQGAPTDKLWVTESGDPAFQGWVQKSRWEEAHAGWGYEKLRWSGAAHVVWYQYRTDAFDGWDSALLDDFGRSRPAYCVIAYNEKPLTAMNDPRCSGA